MVVEHGIKEEWKTISTHPEYSVSNTGYVKNNRTGRILLPKDKDPEWAKLGGYVCLYHKWYSVAYLVYVHFIGARPRCHSIQVKDLKKPPHMNNLKAEINPAIQPWSTGRNPKLYLLPGQEKLIKHLYLVDKMPVRKIAQCLGLSDATVYGRLKAEGVKFTKRVGKHYV